MHTITPCIWYTGQAEEAMNFYVDVFGANIKHIERYTGSQGVPEEDEFKGKVLTGIFEIGDDQIMCLDGPKGIFVNNGTISLMVTFDTQSDLDAAWDKLTEGGKPQQCGWISDKFGITWQIIPKVLNDIMSNPSATASQRDAVTKAMMPMVKLDGPALKAAFDSAK